MMRLFGGTKKCAQCRKTLKPGSDFKGKAFGGIAVGSLTKHFDDVLSAAYKCQGCGTLVCRGCITIGEKCPKCGGIIFDLAESIL
ncbi:hypothetical protein ACFLU4_08315 [Chloroflexota bacterium]